MHRFTLKPSTAGSTSHASTLSLKSRSHRSLQSSFTPLMIRVSKEFANFAKNEVDCFPDAMLKIARNKFMESVLDDRFTISNRFLTQLNTKLSKSTSNRYYAMNIDRSGLKDRSRIEHFISMKK